MKIGKYPMKYITIDTREIENEAAVWQIVAEAAYAHARMLPNAERQRRAAHAAHMARRALRTLLCGARGSDGSQRAS